MISFPAYTRPRSCAGILLKRAFARFLFFVIIYYPATLHAQTHEWFTFSWLEPPQETQLAQSSTPTNQSLPFKLDDNTVPPNVTHLSENFIPPVGSHKRVSIYEKLVINQDLQILPANTSWSSKLPPSPSPQFTRQLIVPISPSDQRIILPSSSTEMRITSCPPSSSEQTYTLEWDPNTQRYAIRIHHISDSILNCITTEPKQASPADFTILSKLKSEQFSLDPVVKQYILEQIADIPWLTKIAQKKTPLAYLVQELNQFDGRALDPHDKNQSLFKTILLQKRGVCRHRAFVFVAIAQAWGFRARLVSNEAHAFAEVFNNDTWYLVDLGGAANNIEQNPPPSALHQMQQNANTYSTSPDQPNEATPIPQTSPKAPLRFLPQSQPPSSLHRTTTQQLAGTLVDPITSIPISKTPVSLYLQTQDGSLTLLATSTTDNAGFLQFSYTLSSQTSLGSAKLILKTPKDSIDF